MTLVLSCPGLDRVLWLDVDATTAVVHGVRHRRPVSVRVPAGTARRLLAAGVPAVDRRERERGSDRCTSATAGA